MPLPNVRSNYLGLESVGQLYHLKKEGSIPSTVFFLVCIPVLKLQVLALFKSTTPLSVYEERLLEMDTPSRSCDTASLLGEFSRVRERAIKVGWLTVKVRSI